MKFIYFPITEITFSLFDVKYDLGKFHEWLDSVLTGWLNNRMLKCLWEALGSLRRHSIGNCLSILAGNAIREARSFDWITWMLTTVTSSLLDNVRIYRSHMPHRELKTLRATHLHFISFRNFTSDLLGPESLTNLLITTRDCAKRRQNDHKVSVIRHSFIMRSLKSRKIIF